MWYNAGVMARKKIPNQPDLFSHVMKNTSLKKSETVTIQPIKQFIEKKPEPSTGDAKVTTGSDQTDARKNIQSEIDQLSHEKDEAEATMKAEIDTDMTEYRTQKMEAVEAEINQMKEDAYQEGLEKGDAETKVKLKELSEQLLTSIDDAVKEKRAFVEKSKKEILDLALAVGKKVIQKEIGQKSEVLDAILDEAIQKITDKEKVTFFVHPEDVVKVQAYRERLAEFFKGIRVFNIQGDDSLEQGGVMIETSMGYIDSRISTKLHLIKEAFEKQYDAEEAALRNIPSDLELEEMEIEETPEEMTEKEDEPVADETLDEVIETDLDSSESEDLGAEDTALETAPEAAPQSGEEIVADTEKSPPFEKSVLEIIPEIETLPPLEAATPQMGEELLKDAEMSPPIKEVMPEITLRPVENNALVDKDLLKEPEKEAEKETEIEAEATDDLDDDLFGLDDELE